jgi:hypothetical protein
MLRVLEMNLVRILDLIREVYLQDSRRTVSATLASVHVKYLIHLDFAQFRKQMQGAKQIDNYAKRIYLLLCRR